MIKELALDDIGTPFNFELFDADEKQQQEQARKASAVRTRSRVFARRAASEAQLASILPPEIDAGDSWHVISQGDVDALSYLAHLLKAQPMDYVAMSTWCMSAADVQQIAAWLETGTIKRADSYVGEIFPSQYADAFEALCGIHKKHGGRVCVFRNHAKLFLCRAHNNAWVIQSSANINTNPRTENTVITADKTLFDHHLDYLSGIHSFDRSFDNWTPP